MYERNQILLSRLVTGEDSSMHMSPFEVVLIGTTVLEINPFFQAVKIARSRNILSVSFWTYLMIFSIGATWFVYALMIRNLPLLVGNAIKGLASLTVMIVYLVMRLAGDRHASRPGRET
jgi:uncharacterized protein with PQ loop repeat